MVGARMTVVEGSGVVVTGGGAGIGRALARRLAAGGGRVVVNDLAPAAAAAVAGEIGGYAVPGDVATEEGVRELIAGARGHLGEIDIFCSNAGIADGTGPDAPEESWQRSWELNVMAHVRASRELLTGWPRPTATAAWPCTASARRESGPACWPPPAGPGTSCCGRPRSSPRRSARRSGRAWPTAGS